MSEQTLKPDSDERKSIQARIDLHQSVLKEYRTRAYQLVLAHATLNVTVARYIRGHSTSEIVAAGLGLVIVTLALFTFLRRLRDKSDGHVSNAQYFYGRLGADIPRDKDRSGSRKRLWGPLIWFPVWVTVSCWVWLCVL